RSESAARSRARELATQGLRVRPAHLPQPTVHRPADHRDVADAVAGHAGAHGGHTRHHRWDSHHRPGRRLTGGWAPPRSRAAYGGDATSRIRVRIREPVQSASMAVLAHRWWRAAQHRLRPLPRTRCLVPRRLLCRTRRGEGGLRPHRLDVRPALLARALPPGPGGERRAADGQRRIGGDSLLPHSAGPWLYLRVGLYRPEPGPAR